MTIVQSHRSNFTAMNILIFVMATFLIIAATGGMLLYNQLVNFRHDIGLEKTELNKTEVANADLKDNLYKLVDLKDVSVLAASRGLVMDKNPEYAKSGIEVSANANY